MKIIDIIVRSFYDIARRGEGIRRLDTAIIVTNFFFTFNEESLFNYFAGSYISNGKISIFYTDSSIPLIMLEVISGSIIWYFTLRTLEYEYLNKRGYTRIMNTHVPKVLGILIVIVHYLISIFLFFYTLSFLPH